MEIVEGKLWAKERDREPGSRVFIFQLHSDRLSEASCSLPGLMESDRLRQKKIFEDGSTFLCNATGSVLADQTPSHCIIKRSVVFWVPISLLARNEKPAFV